MATQVQIARKLGLDVSTVNKILHQVPGLKWKPETVEAVFRTARELGYNLERVKFRHYREHPRYHIDLPVALDVEIPGKGAADTAQARLRDISRGGARLADLHVDSGTIPAGPFKFVLKPRGVKLRKPIKGLLIRLIHNGEVEHCLRFDQILEPAIVNQIRKGSAN